MTNKKATAVTVANSKKDNPIITHNLFGLSRKTWSRIIDTTEAVLFTAIGASILFYGVFMMWFGRCLWATKN